MVIFFWHFLHVVGNLPLHFLFVNIFSVCYLVGRAKRKSFESDTADTSSHCMSYLILKQAIANE